MQRLIRLVIFGAACMLASASAEARELMFGLENRVGGDSNIFRRPTGSSAADEEPDGFYEVVPSVVLRERAKDLRYNFRYAPAYQAFFSQDSEINGVDHFQSGSVDWSISPKDQIGFSQRYSRNRNVRQLFSTIEGGSVGTPSVEVPVDETDRERITRVSASLFASRQWTPVFFQRIGFDYDDVEFNTARNLDSRSYGVNNSFNYVPAERWTVGLSMVGRVRETEGLLEGEEDNDGSLASLANDRVFPRENAYIANIAGTLAFKVTPSIDLSVQVGPTLIWSKPVFEDTTLDESVFATAELKKSWRKGYARLNYSRTESGSTGDGSVIIDSVRLAVTRTLLNHLTVSGVANYALRESTSSNRDAFGLRRGVRIESYSVVGSLRYRITRRVFVTGDVRYREVRQGDLSPRIVGGGAQQTRTVVTRITSGFVGLEYTFEPWVF